jgi:hypothetical protein
VGTALLGARRVRAPACAVAIVARVVALIPDLLFGSQVQGVLAAAGHEVVLLGDQARLPDELRTGDVLVVDLTQELDGVTAVQALATQIADLGVRKLGFYAHVQPAVRDRASQAGFDLVVPRSRMAREGAALVAQLAG